MIVLSCCRGFNFFACCVVTINNIFFYLFSIDLVLKNELYFDDDLDSLCKYA